MDRLRALDLLSECTGDHIWSVEYCRRRGVPEAWIAALADAFESNYFEDEQTIYIGNMATNQYHGVRDVDLAMRIGELWGVDVDRLAAVSFSRAALVEAIRQAIEEG
ncbi:MAG: hypothetical protein KatS3mg111_1572 [Pirellulaceae bacterium]|nr:MAG: hypothetical protein KatS3mg111_1572 [Pirellulaceae bacterium]